MAETKRTIVILITLIILGIAIFFLKKINNGTDTGLPVEPAQNIASTSTAPYEIKSFTYASSSNEATVEYVQFAKLDNINITLEKEARELFNKNVKELETNLAEYTKSGAPLDGREFVADRTVAKELIFLNDQKTVASIGYENYTDMGGAHGSFFFSSDTIDVAKNKKLALNDFLKDGYEKKLTPYIKDKIIRHPETCLRCDALGGEIDSMVETVIPENFVLQKDGLRLLYGAYELGPYVATSAGQELIIPKTDITAELAREW